MDEVVFFHRPSRTAIVTDLIQNIDPGRLPTAWRVAFRAVGTTSPGGGTPRDLRLTFLGRKREARACAEAILEWGPEKVIVSHGQCYETEGRLVLERALAWTGIGGS